MKLSFIAVASFALLCSAFKGRKRMPSTSSQEIISYTSLLATKIRERFIWKNTNGFRESIDVDIINIPEPPEIQTLKEEYLFNIYVNDYSESLRQVNPTMIVLHSMALGSLQDSLEDSGFLLDSVNWGISRWGQLPVGSHFIVDRDGTIYCLACSQRVRDNPTTELKFPLKRHIKEANPFAIGIENIVPLAANWWEKSEGEKEDIFSRLSRRQVMANAKLVRWLKSGNGEITHVFSHSQFTDANFRSKLLEDKRLLPVAFNLEYTTKDKYDIGESALAEIVEEVNSVEGYDLLADVTD